MRSVIQVLGVGMPRSSKTGLEHLVRAAQDRLGVVDHDQALGLRALGEAEGAVVGAGRLAYEKRIELDQATVILAPDALDREPDLLGRVLSRGPDRRPG